MSGYTVGDVLDYDAVNDVPVGTVLTSLREGDVWSAIAKLENGTFAWWSGSHPLRANIHGAIRVCAWRIAHLSAPKPVKVPKVGDVIDTEGQARLLPIGSVLVSDDDETLSATSVKIGDDHWMYYSTLEVRPAEHSNDAFDDDGHRVVYVPDADADTSRTAA